MFFDYRKCKNKFRGQPQVPKLSGREPCTETNQESASLTDENSSTSSPYDDNVLDGNNLPISALTPMIYCLSCPISIGKLLRAVCKDKSIHYRDKLTTMIPRSICLSSIFTIITNRNGTTNSFSIVITVRKK